MQTIENQARIPRMRTINEAADELKALDPHTAISPYHIRRLCLDGVLPRVKAGKKYLINLDILFEYLENPAADKFKPKQNNNAAAQNGIRRII